MARRRPPRRRRARTGASARGRWARRWRRAPPAARALVVLVLVAAVAVAGNAVYQVVRKPTELFFPVSGALYKTPAETWRDYGPFFRRYATRAISPELLAALAQVEGSGNPLVRTYWRWAWAARPFDLYRPASSAVGMYQITDGTFAEASHYCIRHHELAREGAWNDWHACWFNGLYVRVLPADAIELTSAYLDLKVNEILAAVPAPPVRPGLREHLAAVVHLCGAGAAARYAQRGFRFLAGERCGAHDPREYLHRVDGMRAVFAQLAAAEAAPAAAGVAAQ